MKDSVDELLNQTDLLKKENQKLLKLTEEKDCDLTTLRTSVKDLLVEKEKLESALALSKANVSNIASELLVQKEEYQKLKVSYDALSSQKNDAIATRAQEKDKNR